MSVRHYLRHLDYPLMAAALALAVFGVVMIYRATNTGMTSQLEDLYTSQRLYVITGFVLLLICAAVDYHFLTRFYIIVYCFAIVLLAVVLIIGKDDATDTARWLWIPVPGYGELSIQPSEFTKVFMIIFLSRLLEVWRDRFNHILFLVPVLIMILLPVILIQEQPSLSASLVVVVTSLTVLFAGGLYFRIVIGTLALAAPVAAATWFDLQRENPLFINKIFRGYQWDRIETFRNPVPGSDEYLQIQGSLFSVATGGLYGKGFGNNTYVISGHNDFIFSVVAEQFGFVGGSAVLGIMAFIIVKCLLIARRAPDMQGRLIAAGVVGMLIFESFVNVGTVVELLPVTGMPFPFMSYGGSSMWVHMIAIGLVLNVGLPRPKSMFDQE